MPRTIPVTGSAAVMSAREVYSAATLKALCMSHSPTRVIAIKRVRVSWSAPGTSR
jgi:hypothetical protein